MDSEEITAGGRARCVRVNRFTVVLCLILIGFDDSVSAKGALVW